VISGKDVKVQWVEGKPCIGKGEFEKALALRREKRNAEATISVAQLLASYKQDRLLSKA